MLNDILRIYNQHDISLRICDVYLDPIGILCELEAQCESDITNVHLYINELQEKLNTKVTLKEPLKYPTIYIYVDYSENLQNAHNNFHKSI